MLSGGMKRKLSLGMSLVGKSKVIILDEPTSGLDSFMAKSICKLLRDLAHKKGKTIISTIH